jgi:CheY-like chemotaxis protein
MDAIKEVNIKTSDIMFRYQAAEESRRLILHYLHNILSYAKSSASLTETTVSDLRSIIYNCFMVLRFKAMMKKVQLSYCIDGNLPRLYLNSISIRQIFINLLDNAVKYTYNGSVSLIASWKPDKRAWSVPLKFRCSAPNSLILNQTIDDLDVSQLNIVGSYEEENQEPDYSEGISDSFNYHGEMKGKLEIRIENVGEYTSSTNKGTGIGHTIVGRLIKNLGGSIRPITNTNNTFSIKITLPISVAEESGQDVDNMKDQQVIIIGDLPNEIRSELHDIGCRLTTVSTSEEINNIDENAIIILSDSVCEREEKVKYLPGSKFLFHHKYASQSLREYASDPALRNKLSCMLKGKVKRLGNLFEAYQATEPERDCRPKLKILVIDDEPFHAQIVTKMVESKYDVETFIEPLQALEYIKACHSDISAILVDLNMPTIDGLTLCRTIRSFEMKHNFENLPIISMSGDEISKMKLIQETFTCCLTKPFSRSLLLNELDRTTKKVSSNRSFSN